MSIFNSLGSNYDLDFALKALFSSGETDLKKFLEEKYGGQAVLMHKGREAVTFALKSLKLPKNSEVIINGFTCYAVYKAIEEAELKPVLIDIPRDDLNFSAQSLEEKINSKTKVVIIQNTLGYPCDIEAIARICKEKDLILIEDLAHSVGTKYRNGKEAGRVGDIAIFSFSQDKVIDGVSGGALITRNDKWKIVNDNWSNPSQLRQFKDRLYPILTWKIRVTYDFGLGKLFHFNLKRLHLLSEPMDDSSYGPTNLSDFYQNLALISFKNLGSNLEHRKKIAGIYKDNLPKEVMFEKITNQIDRSSNLRFPIFVENREEIIQILKDKRYYLSDIWYDAPIAPKRFMKKINSKFDCPHAERISEKILNLPTHKNISGKQALKLANLISLCLK